MGENTFVASWADRQADSCGERRFGIVMTEGMDSPCRARGTSTQPLGTPLCAQRSLRKVRQPANNKRGRQRQSFRLVVWAYGLVQVAWHAFPPSVASVKLGHRCSQPLFAGL